MSIGTSASSSVSVDVDVHREAPAEPDALDLQVAPHQRNLICQRDLGVLGMLERLAQETAQVLDHSLSGDRIVIDERGDGVEAVEEEVRIQLHAQHLQLRSRRLVAQQRLPLPTRSGSVLVLQRVRHERHDNADERVVPNDHPE
jgi:hypothetical protein